MSVQWNPGNGMNGEKVKISDMLTEMMTEKVNSLRNLPLKAKYYINHSIISYYVFYFLRWKPMHSLTVFILEDALSVWTNLRKYF